MKISREDTILGLPAVAVRDFFRRHDVLVPQFIERELGLKGQQIQEFIIGAEREGLAAKRWAEEECLHLTTKGNRLAQARTRSIRRSTAERALESLVLRAKAINHGPYLYTVRRLAVFGSFLSDTPTLRDLDVAFELKARVVDGDFFEAERAYVAEAEANGRRFSTYVDELCWPQMEIRMKLKNRSPVISLHEFDELARLAAPYRIVLET